MEIGPNSKPLAVFEKWMDEAKKTASIKDPTAMALATLSATGQLHNRIVLCKQWSEDGFVFFTNYHSQKGLDLLDHPTASAVFFWDPLARQIRIDGIVAKTSRKVSEDYWNSRERESQLSQYISKQSEVVQSREVLEEAKRKADIEFANKPIPCPEHWGGYTLQAQRIEFWVGKAGRLHDRFVFDKFQNLWTFRRLYP